MPKCLNRVCAKDAEGLLFTKGDSLLFEVTKVGEEAFNEGKHSKLLYYVSHPDLLILLLDANTRALLLPNLAGGGATIRIGPPDNFKDIDMPKAGIAIKILDEDAYFWPTGKKGGSCPLLDY